MTYTHPTPPHAREAADRHRNTTCLHNHNVVYTHVVCSRTVPNGRQRPESAGLLLALRPAPSAASRPTPSPCTRPWSRFAETQRYADLHNGAGTGHSVECQSRAAVVRNRGNIVATLPVPYEVNDFRADGHLRRSCGCQRSQSKRLQRDTMALLSCTRRRRGVCVSA